MLKTVLIFLGKVEIIVSNSVIDIIYSLSSYQDKFDRESFKMMHFELSRCYLQSVTKITIVAILEKENGIKNR